MTEFGGNGSNRKKRDSDEIQEFITDVSIGSEEEDDGDDEHAVHVGAVVLGAENVGLDEEDDDENHHFIPGGGLDTAKGEESIPPVKSRGIVGFFRRIKQHVDSIVKNYPDLIGFFLNVIAALIFSVMNVLVKIGGNSSIGPFQLVLCRNIVQLTLGCLNTVVANKGAERNPFGHLSKAVTPLLIARGLIGIIGMTCNFYALQMMQIEEATIISFLQPVLTAILGFIFLKEKLTKLEIFGMPFSFIGILFVAAPPSMFGWLGLDNEEGSSMSSFDESMVSWSWSSSSSSSEDLYWGILTPTWKRTVGAIFGLIGCLGSALAYIMTRKIGKRVHHTVVINWLSLCGVILPILPMLLLEGFKVPEGNGWISVILIGVVAFGAQTFLMLSLRTGIAGRVALANYTGIVWAFMWGVIIFHEPPKVLSYIGTLFIGINAGLAIYKAWFIGKHHDDKHVELTNLADTHASSTGNGSDHHLDDHDDDFEHDHNAPILPQNPTPMLDKGVTPILP